jgi:acyl-CoA thioesterase I
VIQNITRLLSKLNLLNTLKTPSFWASSAILFLALTCLNPATAKAPPAPAKPQTVLVFGDSLCAAYNIAPTSGWVYLLEQKLAPRSVKVVNACVSGETTSGGLARLPAALKAHAPTVVVLELGANDALRGLSVKQMRANLDAMVTAAQKMGARVLVLGIQIPSNYGPQYTNDFKAVFVDVAKKFKLDLIPFFLEALMTPAGMRADLMLDDRLHPNAAAQPMILATVLPMVEKQLIAKTAAKQ